MNHPVIVYSMEDCVECTFVKKALTQEGVPFEVRDITTSDEYKKEVEKFGFLGVPVIVIGDRAVKGFNQEFVELIQTAKQS